MRDVLLEAAHHGLYRVHWSPKILDDALGHLLQDQRIAEHCARKLRASMENVFPGAVVNPPAELAERVGCDPSDRHVVAAAMAAKAELIVTRNTRHFPAEALMSVGINAVKPDQFLCNLLDLSESAIYTSLNKIVGRRAKHTDSSPIGIANALIESLKRDVETFASRISEFLITEALP
ncbi:MAG: PIN domain-containing protein [Cyanobacteria bacterium MAG CAR4_bin_6]|nr:PIN domain-containing protein [Cyanobacteria bacterium MAG CAR4_bin_6]